jgi:hypothetical protein
MVKKSFFFLFFFLCVFVGLVSAKFFLSYTLSPTTAGINGYLEQKKVDVLFVGSSLFRQNYSMKIFERKTDKSCYLLAYNGLTPSFAYQILKYLCEKTETKPKVLVMDAYPYLCAERTRMGDIRLMNDAPASLKMAFVSILAQHVKMTPKAWWHALVQNNETLLSYPFTHHYIDHYSYKGSYENKVLLGMNQADFEAVEDPLLIQYGKSYQLPKLYDFELLAHKNIRDLCEKNDIELYYIFPPVSQFITDKFPYSQAHNLLNSYLIDSLKTPENHIFYPESIPINRKKAQNFSNAFHLSTQGRDSISTILGERLRNYLSAH